MTDNTVVQETEDNNDADQQLEYIIALDIGSSSIRAVGAAVKYGEIHILGFGRTASTGMSENGISSMEKLRENISTAYNAMNNEVQKSVRSLGHSIDINNPRLMVLVPGRYIFSKNNEGSCDLHGQAVNYTHVDTAVNVAKSLLVPDYDLVCVRSNYYQVDMNDCIDDPIGIIGGQLKSFVHSIYVNHCFLETLKQALVCVRTKYMPEFISGSYAAAAAVLTEEDRALGVCLMDIGAASVDTAIYNRGYLINTASSQLAANKATRDISVLYALSMEKAEIFKKKYGCTDPDAITKPQRISIKNNPGFVDGGFIINDKDDLADMLNGSYTAMFKRALSGMSVVDKKCEIGAGIVLTGGGAKIRGVAGCLKHVLEKNGANNHDLFRKIRVAEVAYQDQIHWLIPQKFDLQEEAGVIGLLRLSTMMDKKLDSGSISKFKNRMNKIMDWFNKKM